MQETDAMDRKAILVKMDREFIEKIDACAKDEHKTRAAMLRHMAWFYLDSKRRQGVHQQGEYR